jgi:phage N-6-adenine-methyltransferase
MGEKDEYYTPRWVFETLNVKFDLDVCAPIKGSHANAPFWFYEEIDGLAQRWHGNVWMNPPYSNPTPWVDKFIEHRNGIALIITSKAKWFHKLWNDVDGMTLLPVNMKFERHEGFAQIQFQTVLFAYGQENANALKKLDCRVR